jgi:hypothetical protein
MGSRESATWLCAVLAGGSGQRGQLAVVGIGRGAPIAGALTAGIFGE